MRISALLSPLALAYRFGLTARSAAYRRGLLETKRLSRPVISVGNLTVGGTGKTPLVAYIVERLQAKGVRPAILTRGYRRDSGGDVILIEPGAGRAPDPRLVGDEPVVLAAQLPDVPIAVSADRYAAGRRVESTFRVAAHVLDDGFQHFALARDLDVVAVDSTRATTDRLLPAGRLREPWPALRRAQIVVLTRSEQGDLKEATRAVMTANPRAQIFHAATRLRGLMPLQGGPLGRQESISTLQARPVLAFCGIGHPENFFRDLRLWGFTVVATEAFRDHYGYRPHDLDRMGERARAAGAQACVTTEKDAVKIGSGAAGGIPIFACAAEIEILETEAFEAAIMAVVAPSASNRQR